MPKPTSLDRDSPHRDRTAPRNIVLTRHPAPHGLFRRFAGKWLGRAARVRFDFRRVERFYRRGVAGPYDRLGTFLIALHERNLDDRACSTCGRRAGAARIFRRFQNSGGAPGGTAPDAHRSPRCCSF